MSKVENDEEEGPEGPRTPPKYLWSEEMEEEMFKVEKDEEEGSRMPMLSALKGTK